MTVTAKRVSLRVQIWWCCCSLSILVETRGILSLSSWDRNPLECTGSAKITQKCSLQPLSLEQPCISKGGFRFLQSCFSNATFGSCGSHLRVISHRAWLILSIPGMTWDSCMEHPRDSMGFLHFHKAAWCCSLTWLSVWAVKQRTPCVLELENSVGCGSRCFFLSRQADLLQEILVS